MGRRAREPLQRIMASLIRPLPDAGSRRRAMRHAEIRTTRVSIMRSIVLLTFFVALHGVFTDLRTVLPSPRVGKGDVGVSPRWQGVGRETGSGWGSRWGVFATAQEVAMDGGEGNGGATGENGERKTAEAEAVDPCESHRTALQMIRHYQSLVQIRRGNRHSASLPATTNDIHATGDRITGNLLRRTSGNSLGRARDDRQKGSVNRPGPDRIVAPDMRRPGPIANAVRIIRTVPEQLFRVTFSPLMLVLHLLRRLLEPMGYAPQVLSIIRKMESISVQLERDAKAAGNPDIVFFDSDTSVQSKVHALLQDAIDGGCQQAHGTRALLTLLPLGNLPVDTKSAFERLNDYAGSTANATGQFLNGFMHSSGLKDVELDQAQALLYYTFAAFQGLPEAELALGYRYWTGISVKQNCFEALDWYEQVAERSYAHFLSGPPGGRTLPPTSHRLSDLDGGIYGMGASWASTGPNSLRTVIRVASDLAKSTELDDVLEWYQYQSDRESYRMTAYLGKIFYTGSAYSLTGGLASGSDGIGAVARDFERSKQLFLRVARILWPTDPELPKGNGLPDGFGAKTGQRQLSAVQKEQIASPAALSAAYLGRMYLRGEGVKQHLQVARMWLKRSSDLGDREAHNMLGIIYRDGLGVKPNLKMATTYFTAAAQMELAEARIHLGKLQLDTSPDAAKNLFSQAIAAGNNYEAYYHLAKLHAKQARMHGRDDAQGRGICGATVSAFKSVAERGDWLYDYVRKADEAWANGEKEKALVNWLIAGELGYESAQNNVAYLLDREVSRRKPDDIKLLQEGRPFKELVENPRETALTHWTRSAAQQNVDSVVKVGDYFYNGTSTDDRDFESAAGWYQSAADTQASAIAFWNLGWMYENGVGVTQDFHLAKRYYDLCRETDSEAYIPVFLSLIKLHVRSWWAGFIGGKQKALALFGEDTDSTIERTNDRSGSQVFGRDRPILPDQDDLDLVEWSKRRESDEKEAAYDDYLETGRTERRRAAQVDGQTAAKAEFGLEIDDEVADFIMIGLITVVGILALWRSRRRRQEQQQPEPFLERRIVQETTDEEL